MPALETSSIGNDSNENNASTWFSENATDFVGLRMMSDSWSPRSYSKRSKLELGLGVFEILMSGLGIWP